VIEKGVGSSFFFQALVSLPDRLGRDRKRVDLFPLLLLFFSIDVRRRDLNDPPPSRIPRAKEESVGAPLFSFLFAGKRRRRVSLFKVFFLSTPEKA